MKKTAITALIFGVFSLIQVQAQERVTIGIFPFTFAAGTVSNPSDVYSVQEAVINGFVKTKRFTIVDRTKKVTKTEIEENKDERYIDSKKLAEQGKNLGAQFLVLGHVISVSIEESRSVNEGKESVSYEAKISTNIQIIDVETGEISTAEIIKLSSDKGILDILLISRTPEAAVATAITRSNKVIEKFVDENFPILFHIAEIQEKDGKGNATKILIAGGSDFGVKRGDELNVVEIVEMNVAGKMVKRKKGIGRIKVSKVEDENFSICEVKEGGIEINSKFQAKAKLQVVTKN